ncbi:MAG: hypothetical protein JW993_13130 [Sedimentisphaerales bacterium]|nr:hypothetical protein [Sedimentisphaerales bacterium]
MLAKHADTMTSTSCLICGTHNAPDALLCSECCAPMALVQDAVAQEREPRIVSVIGESNVGKTVYLGFLLDMLAQRAGDFEAVPKGAHSIDLQQTVMSHMARRVFPPKTPMEADQWYWAYYQVRRRAAGSPWADLVMPDMAGESLAAEVAAPQTFRVIRNLLNKSAGMLLLVDAALAANGSTQPDFFGMKMLSYIDSMYAAQRGRRIQTPIAVLLCKADHCPECFDNPRDFVQANLCRSWNLCESRFENVEFFAVSVVGSLGYATSQDEEHVVPVPLHTALQGVLEPFEWIIDQL